jgi:hypothetical protein
MQNAWRNFTPTLFPLIAEPGLERQGNETPKGTVVSCVLQGATLPDRLKMQAFGKCALPYGISAFWHFALEADCKTFLHS